MSWLDSSRVVFHVRRITHGSLLVAQLRVLRRAAPAATSIVITRLIPLVWRPEAGGMAPLAAGSVLLRTVERGFERTIAGWREFTGRSRLTSLAHQVATPIPMRVRLAGWAALTGAITHIAIVGIDALLAPPAAGVGWLAAVPMALTCIMKPEAVTASWQRTRERWRRL